MKWWLNNKFIILIVVILFVFLSSYWITDYYKFKISGNVISLQKKIQLSNYATKEISIPQKRYLIIVINESICGSNLALAYKMVRELNPNYIYVIFDSKNITYSKPLSKIYATIKNKGSFFIDSENVFSDIFPFLGSPLILYFDRNKIVAGKYLQKNNYDKIGYEFSKFISNE